MKELLKDPYLLIGIGYCLVQAIQILLMIIVSVIEHYRDRYETDLSDTKPNTIVLNMNQYDFSSFSLGRKDDNV